jgi:2-methylcitrate dehydratase PrpD
VLTRILADYATTTSSQAIPAGVKERAKQVIFDEMACACFGQRSAAGDLSARYAATIGGTPEAGIIGTDQRAPAPYAALVNGTAGHGEEVDGTHVVGGHPGATIVPAAIAMAERQRATGSELINAVVLGYDIGARMVSACGGAFALKQRHHVHADSLYGLGAAVAGGRLLGLDAARHCHAMALTTFQANGLTALFGERRHISKSFSHGQYAFAGVSAALMAGAGLEGVDDILGGSHGLLDAWGIENARKLVTQGLAEEFAIMDANFKFMNAGYPIHAALEAAAALIRMHDIGAATIAAVHVGMPAHALRVVDNRDMPSICVQDVLAATLVRGSLGLRESPFPAILDDPEFSAMRARITVGIDPGLERDLPNGRGARVAITTTNGSVFAQRVDWPRGHARRGGTTWEELSAKWHDALPNRDVDRPLQLARRLEDLDDARALTDAFA